MMQIHRRAFHSDSDFDTVPVGKIPAIIYLDKANNIGEMKLMKIKFFLRFDLICAYSYLDHLVEADQPNV
jgi:hypothetical protein